LERLKGRRLFVGTPMYAGECHSAYAFALAQLATLCAQLGIALRLYFACNEALITRARNATADEFLRAGDDHLVFIDADIGFDARDVIQAMALQALSAEAPAYDVLAAPYPLKQLAWAQVREAAKQGLGDADPGALARYAGEIPVSPREPASFPADRPVEVTQAGTGFMMIRRETFERYRAHYRHRRYRPEGAGIEAGAGDWIHAFFDTEIDDREANLADELRTFLTATPQATHADLHAFLDAGTAQAEYSGRYLSEDYAFCRRLRAAGMRVWLCPWMAPTHTGSHTFTGSLIDLAALRPA
jgi:hypothetical protein